MNDLIAILICILFVVTAMGLMVIIEGWIKKWSKRKTDRT